MPFILSRVSCPVSKEQEVELKSRLGRTVAFIPGMSEQFLLAGFQDNWHFYLRGDDSRPVAYIEVSVFSNERHRGYDRFSAAVTEIFHAVLGIDPDRVYIKFSDIQAWAVGGRVFDRNGY